LLRRLLPYTTVLMVLVAIWTVWILYSRYQSAAEAERQSKEKQAEVDRKLVTAFGGDELSILGFNTAEKEVSPGGRVLMCYGVSNATAVKIEPEVEPIKPALQHCLEVFPKKTTDYTLTASDGKGNTQSKTLTIRVRVPN
jgi:hypothetical protein